jgi:hypothetical protein
MKIQSYRLIVSWVTLSWFVYIGFHCKSEEIRISNKEELFRNCMETFQDQEKCSQFLNKSEESLRSEEELFRKQRMELTEEQLGSLKLRSEIKAKLQSRNRAFVISYLGEPDLVHQGGDQSEYLIYKRPISKYSPESLPDEEITVIIRRGKVDRVNHKPPVESAPDGFSFRKLMENRDNRLRETSEK